MRKFFDDFSCESNEEKITEKTMTARAISTVAIMVVCLIAMTVTAYAYFSYNVTVPFGIIKAANFETKITVQEITNEVQTASVEDAASIEEEILSVITSDYKAHKVEGLKAGKTYQVTITPTEKNTAEHGFVIFAAYHTDGNGNSTLASPVYHTQQLGVDVSAPNGRTDVISFELVLDADACVIFYSHWGTSSYYGYQNAVQLAEGQEVKDLYVEQGERITIAVTGAGLEELEPTPTPLPELTPTPLPEATPTPASEATSTPAPTGEPTAEPTKTSAPEATSDPEATEAPAVTATEAPVAEPTTAPAPVATTAPAESSGSETTGEATSNESEATNQSEAAVATTTLDTPQTTSEVSEPIE